MKYSTSVRKRRRRSDRLEWMARLIYRDPTTGKRRERSRSARTRREAILLEMALRHEFILRSRSSRTLVTSASHNWLSIFRREKVVKHYTTRKGANCER